MASFPVGVPVTGRLGVVDGVAVRLDVAETLVVWDGFGDFDLECDGRGECDFDFDAEAVTDAVDETDDVADADVDTDDDAVTVCDGVALCDPYPLWYPSVPSAGGAAKVAVPTASSATTTGRLPVRARRTWRDEMDKLICRISFGRDLNDDRGIPGLRHNRHNEENAARMLLTFWCMLIRC